jgi:hypothetical protein
MRRNIEFERNCVISELYDYHTTSIFVERENDFILHFVDRMNSRHHKYGGKRNASQRLWRRRRLFRSSNGRNIDDLTVNRSQIDQNEIPFVQLIDSSSHMSDHEPIDPQDDSDEQSEEAVQTDTCAGNNSNSFDDEIDSSNDSITDESQFDFDSIFDDNSPPLYQYSSISSRRCSHLLIQFCRRVKLNKRDVKYLLDTLQAILPPSNKLARTWDGLLQQAELTRANRVSYHCSQCFAQLGSFNNSSCSIRCDLNGESRSPLHVIELYTANVEKQLQIVAERHLDLIDSYIGRNDLLPCDVVNSRVFKRLPVVADTKHLTLLLQTDGAPLVKSSNKSLWPVQATIAEIPPPVREFESAVMIFGAWLGSIHPNRHLLWSNMIDQIKVSKLHNHLKFHCLRL